MTYKQLVDVVNHTTKNSPYKVTMRHNGKVLKEEQFPTDQTKVEKFLTEIYFVIKGKRYTILQLLIPSLFKD